MKSLTIAAATLSLSFAAFGSVQAQSASAARADSIVVKIPDFAKLNISVGEKVAAQRSAGTRWVAAPQARIAATSPQAPNQTAAGDTARPATSEPVAPAPVQHDAVATVPAPNSSANSQLPVYWVAVGSAVLGALLFGAGVLVGRSAFIATAAMRGRANYNGAQAAPTERRATQPSASFKITGLVPKNRMPRGSTKD